MWQMIREQIKPAILVLLLFSIITGIIYPLLITALGNLIFPYQASGSLMLNDGKVVGSALIGQFFKDPQYFWGRPSATALYPYHAMASGGSNLAPSHPELINLLKQRINNLHQADPENTLPIPLELITSSGSGLDPQISPRAALYQTHRIAKARKITEDKIISLINEYTEPRQFNFLGESRVNILKLNLALDDLER
jgi:potassium-transporting ATPase KdpC subunit